MFGWFKAAASGERRSDISDFWWLPAPHRPESGANVTHYSALGLSVVWACVRVISEAVGSLPIDVFAREVNGDKRRLHDHPLAVLLREQANDEHTAMEFREMLQAHMLLRGNAYAEIGRRGSTVTELIPIHPDNVRPITLEDASGRKARAYEVTETGAPARRLLSGEVLHVRAMTMGSDARLGVDPITLERETIGAAIAARDYASRFFGNDATPGGIVKGPGKWKDDEAREKWKKAWDRAFGGRNRGKTALLEFGMEYQQIGLTNEQAQFLETRKYLDVDITRIFRVPPHKVGILDRATNNNIEHQGIEFVTDTLTPWLVRWEQAIKRDLIVRQGLFAEHNVMGLLRGDIESRYRAYAVGRNWGWLSANDVRRLENMNSIGADGDQYLHPTNMIPAGEAGEPSGMGRPTNGLTTREKVVWVPRH